MTFAARARAFADGDLSEAASELRTALARGGDVRPMEINAATDSSRTISTESTNSLAISGIEASVGSLSESTYAASARSDAESELSKPIH
jgi:hypothetical protein